MLTRLFASAVLAALPFALHAADAPGTKDHPALKRVEGSEIIWGKALKFDEVKFALEKVQYDYSKGGFKETKKEVVEGAHTILYYRLPGDVSTLEAVRQYEADLKAAGFTVLFTAADRDLDDGYNRFVEQIFPAVKGAKGLENLHGFNNKEHRYAVLKGKGKNGADVYVSLYAFVLRDLTGFPDLVKNHKLEKNQTVVRVDIVETTPMENRMVVVKADEINSTIAATGRIAIYGVYFDTDKAEIKSESKESLAEMAKAIQAGSGSYLVVGHTDSQGDFAHNQNLSKRRAEAVAAALTKEFGVPAGRVIPVGVGMAAPVASNDDEAGRAKNRRVELVKM